MGYGVSVTEMSVSIPEKHEKAAFEALLRFNEECPSHMKRGGGFVDGEERRWFSWMRPDFSEYEDLGMILNDMGFSYSIHDGKIFVAGWHGDKQGQEDLLMESIAEWVDSGSFVDWIGEDCYRYRWEFEDGRLWLRDGTNGWSEEKCSPTERRIRSMQELERFKLLMSSILN